jgi:hypothetical protein
MNFSVASGFKDNYFVLKISNKIGDKENISARDYLNIITEYNDPITLPNRIFLTCELLPKNTKLILEGIESIIFLIKNVEWLIEFMSRIREIKDIFGISVYIRDNNFDLININDRLEILSIFINHKKMVRFNRINQARARDKGYSEILRIAIVEKRLSIQDAVEFTAWHISKNNINWIDETLGEFSLNFLKNIKEKYGMENLNGKPIMENKNELKSNMSKFV